MGLNRKYGPLVGCCDSGRNKNAGCTFCDLSLSLFASWSSEAGRAGLPAPDADRAPEALTRFLVGPMTAGGVGGVLSDVSLETTLGCSGGDFCTCGG